MLQRVNVWLTATGAVVFAALFWFVHGMPDQFDRAVGQVVVAEVGDQLHTALPSLLGQAPAGGSLLDEAASRLPGRLGEMVEGKLSTAEFLSRSDADELAERFLAEVCECYRAGKPVPDLGPLFARALVGVQDDLARTEDRIRTFALGQYHAALSELRQDVSIFAGTTLALFLAALLLGLFKGRASTHLLPVSLVLTLATLLTSTWYIFGQDWIMTVVMSNYWGMAYPVFAVVVAGFLLDIALFRARVTTLLIRAVTSIPVVPC
jgi:hypothetical protein